MQYPSDLFNKFDDAQAAADALARHPYAPKNKSIKRDTIYMWKSRDWVPYMWQPAVRALALEVAALRKEFPTQNGGSQ